MTLTDVERSLRIGVCSLGFKGLGYVSVCVMVYLGVSQHVSLNITTLEKHHIISAVFPKYN